MDNDLNELIRRWKFDRGEPATRSINELINAAKQKKKSTLSFHYGNIAVLTVVALMLLFFFRYLFPFQELVSRIGVALMVGGLFVRIAFEIYSSVRSHRIDPADTARSTTEKTIAFYRLRTFIHGPVTFTIVGLYTIGFAMLTPEFLKHIGTIIYFFDALYVAGAVFLIWQIGKGIKKEMQDLRELIAIREQLG